MVYEWCSPFIGRSVIVQTHRHRENLKLPPTSQPTNWLPGIGARDATASKKITDSSRINNFGSPQSLRILPSDRVCMNMIGHTMHYALMCRNFNPLYTLLWRRQTLKRLKYQVNIIVMTKFGPSGATVLAPSMKEVIFKFTNFQTSQFVQMQPWHILRQSNEQLRCQVAIQLWAEPFGMSQPSCAICFQREVLGVPWALNQNVLDHTFHKSKHLPPPPLAFTSPSKSCFIILFNLILWLMRFQRRIP